VFFDKSAGCSHLLNGPFTVTGIYFNRTHRFFYGDYFETFFKCVEHSVLNAVVSCETTNDEALNLLSA
jgi:hypothetical protein